MAPSADRLSLPETEQRLDELTVPTQTASVDEDAVGGAAACTDSA